MKSFFQSKETGILQFDVVLLESYHPILFTCVNEKDELFLCVCCQADKEATKWLATDVKPSTMVNMLQNQITIRDAFLLDKGKRYTVICKDKKYTLIKNDPQDWDPEKSDYLPTAGEYMDAEDDEFLEEIEHYKNIMFQNIFKKNEELKKFSLNGLIFEFNMHEENIFAKSFIEVSDDLVIKYRNTLNEKRQEEIGIQKSKFLIRGNEPSVPISA